MREHPSHVGVRRRVTRASIASVALGLAAWLVFGVAGLADPSHARNAANAATHVIERAVTDTTIQSGGKGDKTGNLLTFHNEVFDATDTKKVGTDQGYCVRISPKDGTYECNWTTFLGNGQITVAGPFFDTKSSVLAITGGTGAYRNARGEMNLKSLKN